MVRLARSRPNVQLIRHPTNLGGAVARNTAVSESTGELIFSLDGDDMLGPDFLEAMTQFWLEKRSDAVGMSTSIKFRGNSTSDVAYVSEYEAPGEAVRFESLLGGPNCSLSVVFLMTRKAFNRVGGYPTEHGFDNPGMGFRFLCNGMSAYTCPQAVYFHRVQYQDSWYVREYAAGLANWNWFCLLDEYLYVFRDEIKDQLLDADLFEVPGKPSPAPLQRIVRGRSNIYQPDVAALVKLGRERVALRAATSKDKYLQYWVGGFYLASKDYERAIRHFGEALAAGFDFRIIYYKMLLASLRRSGRSTSGARALRELALYSQPYPVEARPLRQRLIAGALTNPLTRLPVQLLNSAWLVLRGRSMDATR
jgi:glycosyltransferase involved in cell wall biosynthesis